MSDDLPADNRTESLPHQQADVSANRFHAKLVIDEIRSTRVAWTLCEAGKLPIDYAADVKNLWNLFDKRIGAPPDIGDVKDQQQARMALRLMEAALTPTPLRLMEAEPEVDELPWEDNPAWDRLARQQKLILRYMHNRDSAQVGDFVKAVWGESFEKVREGTIHTAISRANKFLEQVQDKPRLEKPRDKSIVRWV
jgi:hypothetical protein